MLDNRRRAYAERLPQVRAKAGAVDLEFAASGNRFRDLMLTLVTSEVFRTVSAEET